MREFISLEITDGIVEQTPVIFGMVKEEIMEVFNERFGAFRAEVMVIVRSYTFSLCEFRVCGATMFYGEKDPIASRRWLENMANVFTMSFCPEESKVIYASYLLKDRAWDYQEEVRREVDDDDVVDAMTWDDFSTRFNADFALVIEL